MQVTSRLLQQRIVVESGLCDASMKCACCAVKTMNRESSIGQLLLSVSREDNPYSVVWRVCDCVEAGSCACKMPEVQQQLLRLFDAASPSGLSSGMELEKLYLYIPAFV